MRVGGTASNQRLYNIIWNNLKIGKKYK
uniref:Uncharacterized protein n=1 Tax=Ciona intestinalis TaxID=7719 RepID=H2XRZ6_CIOIN